MSSGVKVDPECVEAFTSFKIGKKDKAFIIFKFNDEATKIVVEHIEPKLPPKDESSKNAQWETLINKLPKEDVRYVVADVHFNNSEGNKSTEMVFISWAPEKAPIKRKMLVASSKDALKNALVGIKTLVQATCFPDLDLRNVVEKLKGTLD